ncbi:PREDICTED: uncharacterized oxidoreductase TM_0325-like [Papilio xuthus]|uniref:Uncharacterized oxidoreductase TM_0325-like n=1 Tax=Papilio xuthus TaxID=66420 RepID=A0AAJ7E8W5_PAPXU|nr:PREDICTED: uncharacterized oxidoreductase TM_0325-like [Papilio xuthus]
MSFDNKVVIITGSSSGIGASTAIALAKEGAHVVIGRNEKKMKKVNEKCESYGKKPLVVKADVSKDEEAKKVIDETIKTFGKLDVLINNAGVADWNDITSDDFMKKFDAIMNINLRAAVYLTHLAIPHLIKTKGNIINTSSIAGSSTLGMSLLSSYCTSKAALNHFSRGVALKLAEYGVRVNVISPGPVRTDIAESMGADIMTWDAAAQTTALKRVSEPEEIADLMLFLASDKAIGITGSVFISDNGSLVK